MFNDKLFLFYNGSGDDGLWYTYYDDNAWTPPIQCRARGASNMGVAQYTSPCPVVYNHTIFLFFNGSGNDGTFYTTSTDGQSWTQVSSVNEQMSSPDTFEKYTSPSAATYQGDLYLFWNKTSGNSLRYGLYNGTSWRGPADVLAPGLGIRSQTSSSAVGFLGGIYLFYNGSGQDGTFMTTLTGGSWSNVVSISSRVGGQGFLDRTSPAAYVTNDGRELTLLWNGSGDDGVWYSYTVDGATWYKPAISMRGVIGGQGLLQYSSPCGVAYHSVPYIFWAGAGQDGLWFTQGLTFNVDSGDFSGPLQALASNLDFTLLVTDPNTIAFFAPRFPPGYNPLPGPSDTPTVNQVDYTALVTALLGTAPKLVGGIAVGIVSIALMGVLQGKDVTLELGPFRLEIKTPPKKE